MLVSPGDRGIGNGYFLTLSMRYPSHPRKMPYNYARGRFSERGRKSDKVRKKNAREEGFAEGRDEGREEGQKEWIMENKVKTARGMLAKGYPVDEIAEITEIPADQLKSL